jgi:hypothetical protein
VHSCTRPATPAQRRDSGPPLGLCPLRRPRRNLPLHSYSAVYVCLRKTLRGPPSWPPCGRAALRCLPSSMHFTLIAAMLSAIRERMQPPAPKRRGIGFTAVSRALGLAQRAAGRLTCISHFANRLGQPRLGSFVSHIDSSGGSCKPALPPNSERQHRPPAHRGKSRAPWCRVGRTDRSRRCRGRAQ